MRVAHIRLQWLITGWFVALALACAAVVPPFENPDEAPHFLYAHYLQQHGALPRIATLDEINNASTPAVRWAVQNHHPPLYYALAALVISPFSRSDLDSVLTTNPLIGRFGVQNQWALWLADASAGPAGTRGALLALRLVNIALGAAVLWLVHAAARLAFAPGGGALPLLAMFLAASSPAFILVCASASNDPLLILCFALGGWGCLIAWRRQALSPGVAALLAAAVVGAALTKLTGLALGVALAGGLLLGARLGRLTWQAALGWVLLAAVALLLGAGWWYARNQALYGDPFALAATQNVWQRPALLSLAEWPTELARIWHTLWVPAGLGNRLLPHPSWLLAAAAALALVAACGALRVLRCAPRDVQALAAWCAGVCALALAVVVWGTLRVDVSYGRLLFPAAVAFWPLAAYGLWGAAGRWAGLLAVPLALACLLMPLVYLPQAYPPLLRWQQAPADLLAFGWQTGSPTEGGFVPDGFVIEGARVRDRGQRVEVFFRGAQHANAAFSVALVDLADAAAPVRLSDLVQYPANTRTDTLVPGQLYSAIFHLPQPAAAPSDTAVLTLQVVSLAGEYASIALGAPDGSTHKTLTIPLPPAP
jgi:hypothetical protein